MSETQEETQEATKKKSAPKPRTAKAPKAPKAEKKAIPAANGELISIEDVGQAIRCFAILKDGTRIRLLMMADGEHSVGDMCAVIGQSQPAVSHHLALLKHSGMMVPRRDGKNNFYELTDAGKSAVKAVRSFLAN